MVKDGERDSVCERGEEGNAGAVSQLSKAGDDQLCANWWDQFNVTSIFLGFTLGLFWKKI